MLDLYQVAFLKHHPFHTSAIVSNTPEEKL
jgi:hypothetical protein